MTRPVKALATLVAIAFLSSIVFAQQAPPPTPSQNRTGQDNMTRPEPAGQSDPFEQQLRQISQNPQLASDKLFVLGCSQESLMGVEIARQAQQKAQNPQVKQLAQQIVQDHQQSNQQLQDVARSLNLQIPQQLNESHQQMVQIISSVPSDQFDKWFTTMTQAHHASALIAYRAVAQIAQSDQLKQYAQRQLPMLSRHYDQSQQAAVALGLPGSGPEAIPASGRIEGQIRDVTPPNTATPRP
jgi:putative membrane protein